MNISLQQVANQQLDQSMKLTDSKQTWLSSLVPLKGNNNAIKTSYIIVCFTLCGKVQNRTDAHHPHLTWHLPCDLLWAEKCCRPLSWLQSLTLTMLQKRQKQATVMKYRQQTTLYLSVLGCNYWICVSLILDNIKLKYFKPRLKAQLSSLFSRIY